MERAQKFPFFFLNKKFSLKTNDDEMKSKEKQDPLARQLNIFGLGSEKLKKFS